MQLILGLRVGGREALANQDHPSGLHDRRPLLPGSKSRGLGPVRVHAGKLLAIAIIHDHLPVAMLAALVIAECCAFLRLFFQ